MNLKTTLAALLIAAAAIPASAQFTSGGASSASADVTAPYNRVGVSYNNTHFGFDESEDSFSLNGIGIDYIHGFSLSSTTPLFLETGGKLNFGFHSDSEDDDEWEYKTTTTMITLGVPLNLVYKFRISDDFSIQPYAGLNFKLHFLGKEKYTVTYEGEEESESYNLFDKDDWDPTFNRFQMGWHIGSGFQYKMVYFGLSWGTDFIKAQKYVNSSDFTVSLGYSF